MKKKLIARGVEADTDVFATDDGDTKEEAKVKSRCRNAIRKGFPWYTVIVDADTGKVFHTCLTFWRTEYSALRKGEKLIKRYERNGNFETPVPGAVQAAKMKVKSG